MLHLRKNDTKMHEKYIKKLAQARNEKLPAIASDISEFSPSAGVYFVPSRSLMQGCGNDKQVVANLIDAMLDDGESLEEVYSVRIEWDKRELCWAARCDCEGNATFNLMCVHIPPAVEAYKLYREEVAAKEAWEKNNGRAA